MRVAADSTDVSVIVRIVDAADGAPETGVTSATPGLAIGYWREGEAVFVGLTESDLATLDAAHSDGGILHIADGYYRVDFVDAAFATGATQVLISGTATDMIVLGQIVDIGPVAANVTAMGADTLTASALAADAIAEINATVDTAISDAALASQTSVDDIPTNAELATELAAADDAMLAAIAALNDISVANVLTTALTESYAAEGADPTLTEAILEILQFLTEKSVAGVTVTVDQRDGITPAATYTLDDAATPTSITRGT